MQNQNELDIRSRVPGVTWPPVPAAEAATLLAMQFELQQTQWRPLSWLETRQMQQLHTLFCHLNAHAPFYRARFEKAGFVPAHLLTPDVFTRIPLLSRAELQAAAENAICAHVPPGHGKIHTGSTSGSTGRALNYAKTELAGFFWHALTLRESLWAGWDLHGRLAVSRADGIDSEGATWKSSESLVYETGPTSIRNIRQDISDQARWLTDFRPDYLITNPTNLKGLCQWFLGHGGWTGNLRGIRTLGEVVTPALRELCRNALNAEIRDMYSAAEIGYIALQCPEQPHYHIQSEFVWVEILRDDGSACLPGEIGKVAITTLHNYAMPLIRYVIGDHAEVGGTCACGRGLPVLKRIMGRSRNLLTFPDGRQWWPTLPPGIYLKIAPIKQLQLVQKTLDTIEVRLVVDKPIDSIQEEALTYALRDMLKHSFNLKFVYFAEIDYGPNHKFDDFISEVV